MSLCFDLKIITFFSLNQITATTTAATERLFLNVVFSIFYSNVFMFIIVIRIFFFVAVHTHSARRTH